MTARRTLRTVLVILVASAAAAGCERSATPATKPFVAATSLEAIPLGAPPGEDPTAAAAVADPFEGDGDAIARGKALYGSMNCVYCHGDQGAGLIGPPLNGRGWRYGGRPAQIYNSIHDGRPQGMPAWGRALPPEEIWRLVAYIDSLGGALPPARIGGASSAASARSTTGDQVAGQDQVDAANTGRQASNNEPPP